MHVRREALKCLIRETWPKTQAVERTTTAALRVEANNVNPFARCSKNDMIILKRIVQIGGFTSTKMMSKNLHKKFFLAACLGVPLESDKAVIATIKRKFARIMLSGNLKPMGNVEEQNALIDEVLKNHLDAMDTPPSPAIINKGRAKDAMLSKP